MNKKMKKIIVVMILIQIVSIPTVISMQQETYKPKILNQYNNKKIIGNGIKLLIYFNDKNGNFQKNLIQLNKETFNNFRQTITTISDLDVSLPELFEEKINIMKNYGIIDQDITLENIFDSTEIMQNNLGNFSIINSKQFESKFAPIFMVGMGFGLGIGMRRLPVHSHLAGNMFSIGLIGMGTVVCLDLEDHSLYYQYTMTYPYLIHILTGFIGIMMFAFDSIWPPENGPAITLYSNFFALGLAGSAKGFELHL